MIRALIITCITLGLSAGSWINSKELEPDVNIAQYGNVLVEDFSVVDVSIHKAMWELSKKTGIPIFVEDVEIAVIDPLKEGLVGELESMKVNISIRRAELKKAIDMMNEGEYRFTARASNGCINIMSKSLSITGDPFSKMMKQEEFEGDHNDVLSYIAGIYDVPLEYVGMRSYIAPSRISIHIKDGWALRDFMNQFCIKSHLFWSVVLHRQPLESDYVILDGPDGNMVGSGRGKLLGMMFFGRKS